MDRATLLMKIILSLVLVVCMSAGMEASGEQPAYEYQLFTLTIQNSSPYDILASAELPPARPELTWSVTPQKAGPGEVVLVYAALNRTGNDRGQKLDHKLAFHTVVNGEPKLATVMIFDPLRIRPGSPMFYMLNEHVTSVVISTTRNSAGGPKDLTYIQATIDVRAI